MSKFLVLLKVQFLSYFGLNKILHNKKNRAVGLLGGFGLLVLLGGLIAAGGYFYSKIFAESLFLMKGTAKGVIALMFSFAVVACLVFSFYSSGSVLYGFKDYDALSAMPVKTSTVVLSKLAFTYLADLAFGVLLVVPSIIVYVEFCGSLGVATIIRLLIMLLFMPLFPMIISVVLGAISSILSSRFKRRGLIQFIFMFVVFVGFYALSFISSYDTSNTFAFIEAAFFMSPWLSLGIGDWLYVLLFVGTLLLVGLAVFTTVCLSYKKINSLVTAVKKSSNFTMQTYGGKSQFKALLIKEIKRLFSCATYAMNTLMGAFLAIVFAVIFAIMCANESAMSIILPLICPPLFAFMFMLAPTTGCSISVEGSSFWIMRTAPIKTKTLFNAKLAVNLLFGVLPAAIVGIVFAIVVFSWSWVNALLIILISTLTPLFGGNLGLIYNLLFPMMKWDNVIKPIKQGVSTFLTVFTAMIVAAIEGVLLYLTMPNFTLPLVIITAVLLVLTVGSYWLICVKGEKLLLKKT